MEEVAHRLHFPTIIAGTAAYIYFMRPDLLPGI